VYLLVDVLIDRDPPVLQDPKEKLDIRERL
jgi:hypothetical protein